MKNKLNARFLVFGAIILTALLLFLSFFLFSRSSGKLIEQNTEMYLKENASAIAAIFNTKLNDQLVMLESQVRYFKDIDLSDYNAMKDTIIATKGIGAFKNIGVANSTGATINYNGRSSGNIMLTDYFKEAMAGMNVVSEITYVDEDGDEVLVIAVPIMQGEKCVGVVYGTFTKDVLDSLVEASVFAETGSNFLLDDDGTILAESVGSEQLPTDIHNFNEITKIDTTSDSENIFRFKRDNIDMLAVKTPIGLHDWVFVTVLPESVISDLSTEIALSVVKVVFSVVLAFLLLLGSIVILFKQIKGVTAEKERMSTELNVATKIQADMMPYNFPERADLSLYATMTPAREVGGDFYDFFFMDEDHLVMVMADVAGKGIPAALFMVNAKSIIRNITRLEKTPSRILWMSNNILCENNSSGLFVTVWLGILTISTGELISANAGHEYPALKRSDGKFQLLEGENCPPLAAMEDLEFEDSVIMLNSGDGLFLYTDGVPEAKSVSGERFGLDRMLDTLNDDIGLDLVGTLTDMKNRIDKFNGDKDPFDDVTMMGLKYFGSEGKS
jgi:serine phosphatase RsbU (regulator of sigma subunit)